MLDAKLLRKDPEKVRAALNARRADTSLVDKFMEVDKKWRAITFEADELKKKRNEYSEKVGQMKRAGQDASALMEETRGIGDRIKGLEEEIRKIDLELDDIILYIPNLPHASTPAGSDSSQNKEIRKWGTPRQFSFKPKAHDEIGANLGILDFDRAAKLSGSRFVVYRGLGSALERALINFMLETHTRENGYTEIMGPVLVNRECMVGTGQLPKFEEEMFKLKDDPFYLIPTAEVSVTNLHREEILPADKLPIKYCCYSPCFRREAGSYGKDVKGIIRQHQFNKVELVKFSDPATSYEEHEKLTADAEKILQKLGLPYRVMALCVGDLGFSSAKTYDLEVWFPSEGKFKEISSCSNFEDFQARRANIRFKKAGGKPEFVHTLNGSGLAVGRTFAAILENCQREDGRVEVPEALNPYLQKDLI
ncbi:MAG TPA: serine--tRNA ligase [Candidatus Omnitrophota bacterium]|nr:serine--tRNA ligase [Candidatus Omnitrophota bacterium]